MDDIRKPQLAKLDAAGEQIWIDRQDDIRWMLKCIVWERYGADTDASPTDADGNLCPGATPAKKASS